MTENITRRWDVFGNENSRERSKSPLRGGLGPAWWRICCAIAVLLLGIEATSCKCQDDSVLAVAEEVTGIVQRDFAASQNQWIPAAKKDEFRVGDAVQSKPVSGAVLSLSDGAFVKLAEKSRIRFLAVKAKDNRSGAGIDVETGELELTAGADGFTLETADGALSLENGSRVRIRRTDKATDILVDIGKAVFIDKNKKEDQMTAGQGISLTIGSAVIERLGELDKAETPPSAETAAASDTAEDTNAKETEAPQNDGTKIGKSDNRRETHPPNIPTETEAPDLSLAMGESLGVHVVQPPSVVAIRFESACPGEGAVQIGGKWLGKGSGTAKVRLKAGRHSYRIFCLDERGFPGSSDVGRGRISVVADSGRKRLPKDAASSAVDVDGRRYKILYQTKLPQVTVRWPDGPKGQSYTLHITSSGKTRTLSASKPELRLPSGDLKEGLHRLKFEAKGSLSRTSRVTEVEIGYDNAAPVVGIVSPSEKGFDVGEAVEIAGESAPGWTASVPGGNLSVDAQNRFKGSILFQGQYRGIAIRLSHPSRGVHYYIRRGRTP